MALINGGIYKSEFYDEYNIIIERSSGCTFLYILDILDIEKDSMSNQDINEIIRTCNLTPNSFFGTADQNSLEYLMYGYLGKISESNLEKLKCRLHETKLWKSQQFLIH